MLRTAAIILLILPSGAPLPAAGAAGPAPQLEAQIREYTLERAGRSAAALARDEVLTEVARAHSRAMYRSATLAHELDGAGPGERVARHHRSVFGLVSENVAMQKNWPPQADVARRLVDGWMDSPGHRANILAPYATLEVGCHGNATTVYCTQLFLRSTTRLAEAVAFHQRLDATVTLTLQESAGTAGIERRVSVSRPNARASRPGVAVRQGAATLPMPDRPGLYQLELWTQHADEPARYRIIGGPYVCVASTTSPEGADAADPASDCQEAG